MRGPKLSLLMTSGASVWAAALSLLLTPVLVRLLGFEAYGLIGLYITLQMSAAILDFGLSATFTRELARQSTALASDNGSAHELATTLEKTYWAMAVIIGLSVSVGAPTIAHAWINSKSLSEADVASALRLAGVALALQFPLLLYNAGLNGLQRVVLASATSFPMSAVRVGGPVAAVLYEPTAHTYFVAQIVVATLQFVLSRWLFWRVMPATAKTGHRKFNWTRLRDIGVLSMTVSGVNISTIILSQADKLLASKLLPLDQFGSYMLASTLAAGLAVIVAPVASTTFPRLAAHAVSPRDPRLAEIYHAATQLLIVIVVPLAALMAVFPSELLLLWTRNPAAAAASHVSLMLLAIAGGISGCLGLLFPLELAHGRTAPALVSQWFGIAVLIPVTYAAVSHLGANGAGCGVLAYTIAMLAWRPPRSHRDFSPADRRAWYLEDVCPPLAAALITVVALKYFLQVPQAWSLLALMLSTVWCVLLVVTVMTTWRIRSQVKLGLRHLPALLSGQ